MSARVPTATANLHSEQPRSAPATRYGMLLVATVMHADMLALKLILTPLLIGAASLAGRRWGPAVGGWFVGLPLTSGPIALFLALDHGVDFAAAATVGSLAGALAEAVFCLAYAAGARAGWPAALAAATLAFAAAATLVQRAALPLSAATACAFVALLGALALMPRPRATAVPPPPPAWDLPARMVITTALVLAITGAAVTLGPRLSGVLATFPVYAAILTVFAHRASAAAAVQVLRGLLLGLFAFAAFFVVLGVSIGPLGVAAGFALATAAALAVQAGSLAIVVAAPESGRLGRILARR
jgi:hypothetical protein